MEIAKLEIADDSKDFRRLTHMQRAAMRLTKDYMTMLSLGVIGFFILLALLAPAISEVTGLHPFDENLQNIYAPPSVDHWLGTDDKGRDHLIRLVYGAQVSLSVAFLASFLSMTIGVSLGIFTGYFGGVVDDLMMWFVTTLNSIPFLFLLLMISALFRPGAITFIMILGLLGWTGTLRLVRGETFALREREYIIAARAMGSSSFRIMFFHILPNLISIVVVALAINIGVLILVESGLSFLGFGIAPPTATWGNMLSDSQAYFRKGPHLVLGPGILISVTVLCLYVIGDGLRDALDPTVTD